MNAVIEVLWASGEVLASSTTMVGEVDGGTVGADEAGDPDGDEDGVAVEVVGVLNGEAVGADVMRWPFEKQTVVVTGRKFPCCRGGV